MKAHLGVWINHERAKPRAVSALGVQDLLWAFEAGHSMALGIPLRETPSWEDQPAVLNARVKGAKHDNDR